MENQSKSAAVDAARSESKTWVCDCGEQKGIHISTCWKCRAVIPVEMIALREAHKPATHGAWDEENWACQCGEIHPNSVGNCSACGFCVVDLKPLTGQVWTCTECGYDTPEWPCRYCKASEAEGAPRAPVEHPFKWDELFTGSDTYRAKVPGGWFVSEQVGQTPCTWFYPDPDHQWNPTKPVLPNMPVVEPNK